MFDNSELARLMARANERRATNSFDCYPECRRDKIKSTP